MDKDAPKALIVRRAIAEVVRHQLRRPEFTCRLHKLLNQALKPYALVERDQFPEAVAGAIVQLLVSNGYLEGHARPLNAVSREIEKQQDELVAKKEALERGPEESP